MSFFYSVELHSPYSFLTFSFAQNIIIKIETEQE